ncbi:MAG: hypothetical protein EOP89_05455 [Lysobacteraceae bacterium]|nr:MAG: hypothetical protein EOP89_05455 [Xanthomonadaceae bacterium]
MYGAIVVLAVAEPPMSSVALPRIPEKPLADVALYVTTTVLLSGRENGTIGVPLAGQTIVTGIPIGSVSVTVIVRPDARVVSIAKPGMAVD